MITIAAQSPLGPDVALLMQRHTAAMHADTPPESIHMMDAGQLAIPEVAFFVLRDAGEALAMGAFKRLGGGHAEIKSMHVLTEARGRGLAARMLDHIVAQARAEGITRLSLETGTQPMFQAAYRLYVKGGFTECPPFADYVLDPNSVFLTRQLAEG